MFRVVFNPSSGIHNTVSAVSDIKVTVTATCRERDQNLPDTVDTVLWAPDNGWNTNRNMLSRWQV